MVRVLKRAKVCLLITAIMLLVFCIHSFESVKAQSLPVININADGSITPSDAPIQQNGSIYTFTGNFFGCLAVHKSNIIVDGSGYTLQGNGGIGIDLQNNVSSVPSTLEIWNVTIENLRVLNFDYSVQSNGGGNDVFFNDYIGNLVSGMRGGIYLWGTIGCNITQCTVVGDPAIYMHFAASFNNVTQCNLVGGMSVAVSANETVDGNYWADYLTKYPNATEIDSTGIGNMPYVFNSSQALGGIMQDNHPLMQPAAIPLGGEVPQTNTVPELPTWASPTLLATITLLTASAVLMKRRTKTKGNP
jgi:hypothetical protein